MTGITPTTGTEDVAFLKLEGSPYDAITEDPGSISFAAGDAIYYQDIALPPGLNREEIEEHHDGSASLEGSVDKQEGGEGSISARFRTYLTDAQSTPDVMYAVLYECAMTGAVAEVNGVSMTYSLETTTPKSFMLLRHNMRASRTELITGGWVSRLAAEVPGEGELPSLSADIGFASYSFLYGAPQVDAQASGTSVTVSSGYREQVNPVGLTVKFGTEDGAAGAGYTITAYNRSTGVLTITPTLDSAVAQDAVMEAIVPAVTPEGTPTVQKGTNCACSVGGHALQFIRWTWELQTGIGPMARESQSAKPTGIEMTGEPRRVSGELEFYFRDDQTTGDGGVAGKQVVKQTAAAWDGTTKALILRIGGAATGDHQVNHNVPAAKLDVFETPGPLNEVMSFSCTWKGQKNSAADDETTVATAIAA